MERLLQDRLPLMDKIRTITRQPGMSIGVLHKGQVFTHNFGVVDEKSQRQPDSDTLYCIASLSKAFMAASLDILVREQKISWDSTIHSIIPEFQHYQKPEVYAELTVRDICSHRSGLLGFDELIQGLDARILLPKKDLVPLCNALPVHHGIRGGFLYSNALYALAGGIVERVSGHSNWGDFQRDRIFKPLGMERTTAFREVHETDTNVATPYMVLTGGNLSQISPTELSSNSMNGGSGGIRSSVNDLLKWCACLLQSFRQNSATDSPVRAQSPIFNRSTIVNPEKEDEGDYCAGWVHHRTPAKLGLISPNRDLESPTLGLESPSLTVYGHQGDVPGYTSNVYLVPESDTAVIILSNGTGLSDATDWIAQDLLQTLHDLKPALQFVDIATQASKTYLSGFYDQFKIPLDKNRVTGTQPPPLDELVGSYVLSAFDSVCLDVALAPKEKDKLQITVDKQSDQVWELWHYNYDVFCYLPGTFDDLLRRGLHRNNWKAFLVSFRRDSDGIVKRLSLTLSGLDVVFTRK